MSQSNKIGNDGEKEEYYLESLKTENSEAFTVEEIELVLRDVYPEKVDEEEILRGIARKLYDRLKSVFF
jgi:hypothetical protein